MEIISIGSMLQVLELKVRLHCKACEKAVRQILRKITGVKCAEMGLASNDIILQGYMDHRIVVKAIQKRGRQVVVVPSSCVEGQNPRLSGGFRCIIPRWGTCKNN